jgi:hypothetical protein
MNNEIDEGTHEKSTIENYKVLWEMGRLFEILINHVGGVK